METAKSKVHYSKEVITQVASSELDGLIAEGKYTIVDVRSSQGVESQGSIPTAINIPLEEVKLKIDQRGSDKDSMFNGEGPFLFCCTGGVMSYMAAIHAQENGVKNVYNLDGGHSGWKKLKEEQVTVTS